MGATMNPIFASGLVPGGMNPTGNQLALESVLSKSTTGQNSLLPQVNTSPSGPASSNPYGIVPTDVASSAPAFPANTGPYPSSTNLAPPAGSPTTNVGQAASSPFSFLQSMSPKDLSRLFDSLKKTYGDGMAHMLLDFLTSGAGFNQQAINNLLASLQPGIERGTESIMEQFSAMGNRFGSPAATGLGDFLSQVNLNEGQLVTQMYEQAINNFMDVMMGTASTGAKRIASSPSLMDTLSGILPMVGGAAGAASAAGVGGTAGSILDVIAGALAL